MRAGPYDDVLAQGRRGTIRVVLVGGAAAIALVALVVAVVAWARPDPKPGVPVGSTNSPASTSPTAPGADVLKTPGLAVEMPDDLTWHDVQGIALPYSASKGPSHTLGGRATGFAHDAAGAVLAAAHIIIRINPEVGPNVFEPTLREQVVGPDVPTLRDTIAAAYATLRQQAGVPYGDPAGQIQARLLGFRVESYSDTEAVVRLIAEGPDAGGQSTTTALRLFVQWAGDDWVLAFPAGADPSTANVVVDTTSLYTPFDGR